MLFACTYLQSNHFIQKTCKIKDKILNRIQTQSKMMEVVKNTRNGHAHGGKSENPQFVRLLIGQRQRIF